MREIFFESWENPASISQEYPLKKYPYPILSSQKKLEDFWYLYRISLKNMSGHLWSLDTIIVFIYIHIYICITRWLDRLRLGAKNRST